MKQKQNQNIHKIDINVDESKSQFLLISDIHFDNPHCRRDILKSHLDEAIRRNAKILINGDFFCVMGGKYDKRSSKELIRPEHVGPNYFDLIVDEAIEWWKPYAQHIEWIGYGNHETAILKRNEIDLTKRFITLMNYVTGSKINCGGYGGWIVFRTTKNGRMKYVNMKYIHGFGGGGIVTKGVIQNQRMSAMVENADIIWMGHVHELYHHVNIKESLFCGKNTIVQHRHVHDVRTSTYKDEFEDGSFGWHIERGAPPKPIGGYWMTIDLKRITRGNDDILIPNLCFSMAIGYI